MVITVEIQDTPNPNTFKFVLNKTLVKYESVSFRNAEEASNNPLSRAIFEVAQSIREVFITENYITVTHDGSENCEGLKNIIRSKILENINFYIPIEEQNKTAGDINEADSIPYQEPTKEQFNKAEGTNSQEELTASGEYNAEIDQESGSLDTLSPVVKAEEFINEAPTPTGYDAEEYIVSEDISEQLDDQTIDDQINNIEKETINTIIDTLIRPALLRDGGDLNIIDYNNNVLTISYKGACITCPHAEEGTLNAMQNILKEKFNPDIVINIAKNANEAKSEELDSQFDEESTDYSDNYDSHLIQEEQLELSIEQNDLSAKKEINTSFDFKSLENDTNINNETENFDT